MNDAHVENKKYPRGDFRFPTWILVFGSYIATLLSFLAIRTLSALSFALGENAYVASQAD